MTTGELKAIEERVAKATRGPWTNGGADCFHEGEWCHTLLGGSDQGLLAQFDCEFPGNRSHEAGYLECVQAIADVEFCAHAREDVPALVAEVRRLQSIQKHGNRQRDSGVEVMTEEKSPADGNNCKQM